MFCYNCFRFLLPPATFFAGTIHDLASTRDSGGDVLLQPSSVFATSGDDFCWDQHMPMMEMMGTRGATPASGGSYELRRGRDAGCDGGAVGAASVDAAESQTGAWAGVPFFFRDSTYVACEKEMRSGV